MQFTDYDISTFEAFATFCGLGIQNTQVYENACKLSVIFILLILFSKIFRFWVRPFHIKFVICMYVVRNVFLFIHILFIIFVVHRYDDIHTIFAAHKYNAHECYIWL